MKNKKSQSKPPRKITKGEVYDKEKTRQKLVDAVGEVLHLKGFSGLNYSSVARLAGVDRKLIYDYFSDLDGLVNAYLQQNDYWNSIAKKYAEAEISDVTARDAFQLLRAQYEFLEASPVMQQIILWEMTQPNDIPDQIGTNRELIGERFFEILDKNFKKSGVNMRAISGILICAAYYMVLYSKSTGREICGIDIEKPAGKKIMLTAMQQVLEWAYEKKK